MDPLQPMALLVPLLPLAPFQNPDLDRGENFLASGVSPPNMTLPGGNTLSAHIPGPIPPHRSGPRKPRIPGGVCCAKRRSREQGYTDRCPLSAFRRQAPRARLPNAVMFYGRTWVAFWNDSRHDRQLTGWGKAEGRLTYLSYRPFGAAADEPGGKHVPQKVQGVGVGDGAGGRGPVEHPVVDEGRP